MNQHDRNIIAFCETTMLFGAEVFSRLYAEWKTASMSITLPNGMYHLRFSIFENGQHLGLDRYVSIDELSALHPEGLIKVAAQYAANELIAKFRDRLNSAHASLQSKSPIATKFKTKP